MGEIEFGDPVWSSPASRIANTHAGSRLCPMRMMTSEPTVGTSFTPLVLRRCHSESSLFYLIGGGLFEAVLAGEFEFGDRLGGSLTSVGDDIADLAVGEVVARVSCFCCPLNRIAMRGTRGNTIPNNGSASSNSMTIANLL